MAKPTSALSFAVTLREARCIPVVCFSLRSPFPLITYSVRLTVGSRELLANAPP